jgi:hypothetical protein
MIYCHRRRADAPQFFNYSIFFFYYYYYYLFIPRRRSLARVVSANLIRFFFILSVHNDVYNIVGRLQANVVMNRKTGFIHKETAVYGRCTRTRRRRSANIYYY